MEWLGRYGSPMTRTEILDLLNSWELSLRAERKSPKTIRSYLAGVTQFITWCVTSGINPDVSKDNVRGFIDHLLTDRGSEPATALSRQNALRQFSAWLTEEGEIPHDETLGMRRVQLDTKIVPSLTDDQIAALLKACGGHKAQKFVDVRDYAIVMFMLDTGCRADETVSMRYPRGIDLAEGTAQIIRGKGGKGRTVGFNPVTSRAIDKYIRRRKTHALAGTDTLWLGEYGLSYGYSALYRSLKRRGASAGIQTFHPHILRHTAASRWLDAGGTEGSLMAKAGWSNRRMLDRYVRSTSERRAIEESQRLNVMGDFA